MQVGLEGGIDSVAPFALGVELDGGEALDEIALQVFFYAGSVFGYFDGLFVDLQGVDERASHERYALAVEPFFQANLHRESEANDVVVLEGARDLGEGSGFDFAVEGFAVDCD